MKKSLTPMPRYGLPPQDDPAVWSDKNARLAPPQRGLQALLPLPPAACAGRESEARPLLALAKQPLWLHSALLAPPAAWPQEAPLWEVAKDGEESTLELSLLSGSTAGGRPL